MSSIVDACIEIGRPIVEDMGYSLVDVEYVKEGRNYVLRYLVDSEHGVDIDEYATISEKISSLLDVNDPIKQEYILEISSPGAERPLKTKEDIEYAVNKYVHVKLYAPLNGKKEYVGDLISFKDDVITIKYMDKSHEKTVEIEYDKISKIRLAIKF